jgi:hypothetical protein
MRLAAALGVAALAVLVAGCGGGSATCMPDEGTGAVEQPASAGTAYLTGMSLTTSGCNDRATFTFARQTPGFRIEYTKAAEAQTEDASGRHIPVSGKAFLVVRLRGARTARTKADGSLTRTYHGPRRVIMEDGHHALEAVKTGDFESVVTWAIGLDGERPYMVSTTGRSIVIDFG